MGTGNPQKLVSMKVWGKPTALVGLDELKRFLKENINPDEHYVEPDSPFSKDCTIYMWHNNGKPWLQINGDYDLIEAIVDFLGYLGV